MITLTHNDLTKLPVSLVLSAAGYAQENELVYVKEFGSALLYLRLRTHINLPKLKVVPKPYVAIAAGDLRKFEYNLFVLTESLSMYRIVTMVRPLNVGKYPSPVAFLTRPAIATYLKDEYGRHLDGLPYPK